MRSAAAIFLAAAVIGAGPNVLARQTFKTPAASAQKAAGAPAAGSKGTAPTPKVLVIDKVLVRVNGEIFTQAQLVRRQVEALRSEKLQIDDPKQLQDDATLKALLNQVTPDILVDAVDELLLVQRAHELDIKFTDDRFKEALDRIKKAQSWDDKQFADALKETGMSMDDLHDSLERTFLVQQVQHQEVLDHIQVTEEEERQYFTLHREEFRTTPTVTLRELLVSVPTRMLSGQRGINVGEDKDAKAKIDAIRVRAENGEDFEALVKETSESSTKANGGLVGPVNVADLNEALATAISPLKPGEITEALRTPQGYEIVKLESRTTADIPPFEQLRNQIQEKISESRMDTETGKLQDRLRAQAVIEWKDDNFKQLYEQRLREKADQNAGDKTHS